ncbi:MAG: type II secretion system F family protein [Betaproteobacteria bacterium]|nr:MAG: type II secretion system F family protein [Betaproteobacteria bacterium]
MALFAFQAVRASGDAVSATIDAVTQAEAIERVREQGLILVSIVPATAANLSAQSEKKSFFGQLFRPRKVTRDGIIAFTRDLANLISAGLPLDRAFELLTSLADSPPLAALMQDLRDRVRGGKPLSGALAEHPKHFDRLYINMVRAGEASGTLGPVLQRISEFQERSAELRSNVTNALIYPFVLIGVAVVAVAVMMFFVVPKFEQTFRQFGKALPQSTENLIAFSHFLRQDGWMIVIALAAIFILVRGRLRTPEGQMKWHLKQLTMPVFGELFQKIEVARLTRTLGTLVGNGVSLLPALTIVKDTVDNRALAQSLEGVLVRLKEGHGFSRPLMETGLYPKLAVHMVAVGEETGQLDKMLLKVADVYDVEVNTSLKRALGLMEPILIVTLAVVVGVIIYSLLNALLGLTDMGI